MNLIREVPQAAKTLINNRSGPTITAQKPQSLNTPVSSSQSQSSQFQYQQQIPLQPQSFIQTPYVYTTNYGGYATPIMVPYGTPYFYNGTSYYQPITYPQFQVQYY